MQDLDTITEIINDYLQTLPISQRKACAVVWGQVIDRLKQQVIADQETDDA